MPYYAIHITGGENCIEAGFEARSMFGGKEADYCQRANYFYVQRKYDQRKLEENLSSFVGRGYDVDVKRISRNEFHWERRR